MRRSLKAVVSTAAAVILTATTLTGAAHADLINPGDGQPWISDPAADATGAEGLETLTVARRVQRGEERAGDPSMTVALRDLWLARPAMGGAERELADAILARPTDGAADPGQQGYSVPATRTCGTNVCVHHVPTSADAPPNQEWVNYSLAVVEEAWAGQVGAMKFRRPLPDGNRGGDSRFDVYLKDLGTGFYGYCTAENRARATTASSYCVLDNDFAAGQFPTGTPESNLRVTAMHEFFHAVQFAYDYTEDPWLMESTATWIEERLANDVNDNRQYLSYSQMYAPSIPLDTWSSTYNYQYGNWVFWEYLSSQYGNKIVRKVWNAAGSLPKDGRKYSYPALASVLRKHGGLPKNYARFAAANLTPQAFYPEGAEYPAPTVQSRTLSATNAKSKRSVRLKHMTSRSFRFVPDPSLDPRWKLEVRAVGKGAAPRAVVAIHGVDGRVTHRQVKLGKRGIGKREVAFDPARVSSVSVSLVNASTKMRCGKKTTLACKGTAVDDRAKFRVTAKARQLG